MNILAAQFDEFTQADAAIQELCGTRGFSSTDVAKIVLGAPGRHDAFPLGGDEDQDAGASKGDTGATSGAVMGGGAGVVAGIAAAVVLGPIAAPIAALAATGIGAYTGSLAGALEGMSDTSARGGIPARPAGVMVMAHAPTPVAREQALAAFTHQRARGIEEAEGQWIDGTWADFSPVSHPHWLVPPAPLTDAHPRPDAS